MTTEEPMSIEDRVRTATRLGATLVRDIRPLTQPDPARFRPRRLRPRSGTQRWVSLGVPLAAAAAVVLVALSLVAVRQLSPHGRGVGNPAAGPTSIPRYYVGIDQQVTGSGSVIGSGALIVGDDLTGNAIATVDPPRGLHWTSVEGGTSDDRTFIVMAARQIGLPPVTGYALRIAPGAAHPYQLTKLPVRLPSSTVAVRAFALSPDGRDLAVETMNKPPRSGAVSTTLGVYSVSSGAGLRSWTVNKDITQGLGEDTLSWLSGGRQLVFSDLSLDIASGDYLRTTLRTIALMGAGTSLLADSRPLITVKTPTSSRSSCWTLHVTPDGRTAICGTQYGVLSGGGANAGCANGALEFIAYSVRTGKLARVLYRYQGPCHSGLTGVLWTDAAAGQVIGAIEIDVANEGGKPAGWVGVIADGRIHVLKLPNSLPPADYLTASF